MRILLPALLLACLAVAACSSEPERQAEPQPSLDEIWYAGGDKPLKLDPRWLVIELREVRGEWHYLVNGSDIGADVVKMESALVAYADVATDSPMLPGRDVTGISENPVVLRAPPSAPIEAIIEVGEMMTATKLYRTVLELQGVADHQARLDLMRDSSLDSRSADPSTYIHISLGTPDADRVSLKCEATDREPQRIDFRRNELFGNGWNADLYRLKRESLAGMLDDLQGTGERVKYWASLRFAPGATAESIPYAAVYLAFDAIDRASRSQDRGDRPRLEAGWYLEAFEPPPFTEDETELPE